MRRKQKDQTTIDEDGAGERGGGRFKDLKGITAGRPRSPLGLTVAGVFVVVFVITATFVISSCKRIEPGQAGILVDYGKSTSEGRPVIKSVSVGYYWQWPRQRLVGYPVAQQTLTMVRREAEGKVRGDDSVQCQDRNGVQIDMDSSTLWRVNLDEVQQLYLLRPNMPLTGEEGGDIEDTVVRRDVRSAIVLSCSMFSYDEIFGVRKIEFGQDAEKRLRSMLAESHLILDKFVPGEIFLQQQQLDAINRVANAAQAAKEAAFLEEKAKREAAAAIAKADGERQVSVLQAQAQAESIRIIQEQLARSPQYIEYVQAQKWDGKLPQVVTGGQGSSVLLPITPGAPTASPTPGR